MKLKVQRILDLVFIEYFCLACSVIDIAIYKILNICFGF